MAGSERLKLAIAYDGRPFHGWQRQENGISVQQHIEEAFAAITAERVVIHGAGRTDAGVHATGQVAHCDVPAGRVPLDRWTFALNAHLPPEIRILNVSRAPESFHARFSATAKRYRYRIWNSPVLNPLEIGRVWHVPGELSEDRLRAAAEILMGKHDFGRFAANRGKPEHDTVRTIYRIQTSRRGSEVSLAFLGDGFLYKMVRLLVGSLVRCAQGREEMRWIQELLANAKAKKTQFAAPAEGLYLSRVYYSRRVPLLRATR